jgi:hypothetical protein
MMNAPHVHHDLMSPIQPSIHSMLETALGTEGASLRLARLPIVIQGTAHAVRVIAPTRRSTPAVQVGCDMGLCHSHLDIHGTDLTPDGHQRLACRVQGAREKSGCQSG